MQLIIEYNVHRVDDPDYEKDNICLTREDAGMSPEDFANYIASNATAKIENLTGHCPNTHDKVTYDLLLVDTDKLDNEEEKKHQISGAPSAEGEAW